MYIKEFSFVPFAFPAHCAPLRDHGTVFLGVYYTKITRRAYWGVAGASTVSLSHTLHVELRAQGPRPAAKPQLSGGDPPAAR